MYFQSVAMHHRLMRMKSASHLNAPCQVCPASESASHPKMIEPPSCLVELVGLLGWLALFGCSAGLSDWLVDWAGLPKLIAWLVCWAGWLKLVALSGWLADRAGD